MKTNQPEKTVDITIESILRWVESNNLRCDVTEKYESKSVIDSPQKTLTAQKNNITFSAGDDTTAGVVFKNDLCNSYHDSMLVVYSDNPKLDFIKCISNFYEPKPCRVITGDNVKIGKNCSIGSQGFGYVKDRDGTWIRFPHYGNVVIGNNVELGDNNTITRGALGDTIIGDGVKTDCGVHIAHNSVIGKNSMFAAHAMISGSVTIGENCWVGPSTSVINKVVIGKNVFIGIGTNVIKDIPDGVVVAGNPAKIIRKNEGLQNSVYR